MPSNDDRADLLRELLSELDEIAEQQRAIDNRDPNALADCERRLLELRQRIARLEEPKASERCTPRQQWQRGPSP